MTDLDLSRRCKRRRGRLPRFCLRNLQCMRRAMDHNIIVNKRAKNSVAPLCLGMNHFVCAFACEAVRMSPYDVPAGLEAALQKVADIVRPFFYEKNKNLDGIRSDISRDWVNSTLDRIVREVPEVAAWGERRNGKTGDKLVSAYSPKEEPDNDFVDLLALTGNVARHLKEISDEVMG